MFLLQIYFCIFAIISATISRANVTEIPNQDKKRTLRVVTVLSDPFVMVKPKCRTNETDEGECQGIARFEGYCIDLLKLLGEHFADYHFELFLSNGNRYGIMQPDGSYGGIIGHLLRGEADLAIASLTINQERERVIDFTQPFLTTGISIIIKKPDRQESSVFYFMAPFSKEVWLWILFAFIGASIVICFATCFSRFESNSEGQANDQSDGINRRHRRNSEAKNGRTFFNSICFNWATVLGCGGNTSHRSLSVQIASSIWFFFILLMISIYTANLAAFLTAQRSNYKSPPIQNVEDLAKQKKIKYGILRDGSAEQFFKHSNVPIYQQMWQFMEEQNPSVFVDSYKEGVERVRNDWGRYAFLLESTANEYTNIRKPCDTMKIGENLNSHGYGVATPLGSELKKPINLAILALQESGELKKLWNKWWYYRGQCSIEKDDEIYSSIGSLTMGHLAGIFYIFIGGMALALVVAFLEGIYWKKEGSKKNKAVGGKEGGGECQLVIDEEMKK